VFRRQPDRKGKDVARGDGLTWSVELVRSLLPSPSRGDAAQSRGRIPHRDYDIEVSGIGVAVHKFESQRLLWGWIQPSPEFRLPCVVVISLGSEDEVASERERLLDSLARGTDSSQASVAEEIVPVGFTVLNGRYSVVDGSEVTHAVVEFHLTLQECHWKPILEALQLLSQTGSRVPTVSIRVRYPHMLSAESISKSPCDSHYAVDRFWIESASSLGDRLKAHPTFNQDAQSGSLWQR
jgi:hypothetical protein